MIFTHSLNREKSCRVPFVLPYYKTIFESPRASVEDYADVTQVKAKSYNFKQVSLRDSGGRRGKNLFTLSGETLQLVTYNISDFQNSSRKFHGNDQNNLQS